MENKQNNHKRKGAVASPSSEQKRVRKIIQAANENKKSNDEPKSNSQKSKQKSSLRFEWSPELKRICPRNGAGELVDNLEKPREILIVHDNICI